MKASLLLHHANVVTMDRARPRAQSVAACGDRIIAVGDNSLAANLRGQDTKVIDCQGKMVVPGFHDAHCHVLAFARNLLSVDCSPGAVRSIEDIKARLRERAAVTPPGTWVVGAGYNQFYLAEQRHPTRHDLDEAVPDRPVKLGHFSGHMCVLNSAGLEAAGISVATEEPPGAVIEREADTGVPSGALFEMDYLVDRAMPPLPQDELDRGVRLAGQKYLSLGITALQDATAGNDLVRWRTFERLCRDGLLRSRVTMMAGWQHVGEFVEAGLLFRQPEVFPRMGPVKLMVTQSTGAQFPSQAELVDHVLRAHRAGAQVAIHAVEEDSVRGALDALDEARGREGFRGNRYRDRIEHCSECTPLLLEELRRLEVLVVTQPPFVYYSGDRFLVQVPQEQQRWLYRIGSFVRAGLTVAASSDSPVVPCAPMSGIYAAVARRTLGGRDLLPGEVVEPLEALAMYTCNAARCCFEETDLGSVSPGKLADMVLLNADPTAVPAPEIKDIRVLLTVLGGEVAWEG